MEIDELGWLKGGTRVRSPNQDERPESPTLIVIHAISLPPNVFGGPYIAQLFMNQLEVQADPYFAEIAHLRVSAHFLIRRDGSVMQFVSTDRRAWHAGVSEFEGRSQCNDFSIGIELEGCDACPFEKKQYEVLNLLLRALRNRYSIRSVVGHSDIAPGRKTDPGPFFDWARVRT